jgi:hypothetical protein
MYKKITHNIVEEHFDHPAVMPVSMSRPDLMPSANKPAGWYIDTAEDNAAIEAFESAVEKLWNQYSEYSKSLIISTLSRLEDADAVKARLLKTTEDLGSAIVPYYGEAAAAELTRLLKDRVNKSVEVFNAIKEQRSTVDLEAGWDANSEALATFLDTADSYNWPKATVLSVLKSQSANSIAQARARFAKDWAADIAANDASCEITYALADTFSSGIINKFPEAFVMRYSSKNTKKK